MLLNVLCENCISSFFNKLTGNHFAFPVADGVDPAQEIATIGNTAQYSWNAVIIGIVAAGVLLFLSYKLLKARNDTKHLKIWFGLAWLLAFTVYDVGMYTGQYISLLTNAPMAVIHAFQTFLLGGDISSINEPFHRSWVFMLVYSFSHALSAFVSSLFLIKIFGFNIIQKLRLFREGTWAAPKRETFVLWGVNSISYRMAQSITEHFGADQSYRIIVVKTQSEAESASDILSVVNKIFGFISLKDSELSELQDLGCFFTNASNDDLVRTVDGDIIRKKLRLKSFANILANKTTEKIHMLFLSDNENQNLHDVSVLLYDSTLYAFANEQMSEDAPKAEDATNVDAKSEEENKPAKKVMFYCHARYNGVHRVIEDLHYSQNIEVKVVDSSHINVELLKNNDDVLPAKFVDVEADGSVSSAFNAMVVGFSEVGQDAVRFIYEFGAFVKTGGDPKHAVRSDFHMDVIDNHMEDKAGVFVANAPAISPSIAYIPEMRNPDALIELHNLDCRSVTFLKMLEQKIKTLNYVVIATENDELNMTMGLRFFRAATRYRKDLDKLCILVRIHDDSDGHFSNIAEYYNKLWKAQGDDNLKGTSLTTKYKRDGGSVILPLYIFGQDKDVYTYDNIIDDSIIKRAMEYLEKYNQTTEKDYKKPRPDQDNSWEAEKKKLMLVNPNPKDKILYHTAYAGLMRLRRVQGQNIANSHHRRTKVYLRDEALKKIGQEDFKWDSIERKFEQTVYTSKNGQAIHPAIIRLLTVLAQTEHIRWNASHEVLGYVYTEEKTNEVRLLHANLTGWENLDDITRSYDNNVVDIALNIKIDIDKPQDKDKKEEKIQKE